MGWWINRSKGDEPLFDKQAKHENKEANYNTLGGSDIWLGVGGEGDDGAHNPNEEALKISPVHRSCFLLVVSGEVRFGLMGKRS